MMKKFKTGILTLPLFYTSESLQVQSTTAYVHKGYHCIKTIADTGNGKSTVN